ncbi:MAG: anthranilate synthase component I [Thermus sp.]|uniref:anthranilate synthase component I n=1 Tax=Thermus sp. TaxID=275 RepID=UPI0025EEE267|nr:anthranilate synthase component I [Thermus sp.]MCS6869031.1 anthranilate synthase component I [Thermus sp.]MCS7218684.1 anthranilate synthase component I [Thermus sp.]MCX7850604.1 anthranilate synthase component I [Thermus sp.]MDW8017853.1 anthranilate synthase component I [Thermus sp.]MDW8358180.1 anthranilate synthase component I [Thermus sp.]
MEPIRPFRKTLLADLETPVTAYLKLSEKAPVSFLLESVERGRQSRFSIVGVGSRRTFRLKDGVFTVNGKPVPTQDPLRTLYEAVHAPLERHPDLPPFFGGVVGYAAYDLIRHYERLPSLKPDDLGLPDLLFVEPEVVLVFDHLKSLLHLVAPGRDPEEAEARLRWAEGRLKGPLPGVPGERAGGRARFRADLSREAYLEAVERALAYIRAGDIFQVVLSLRLSSPLTVHPFALYRALRSVNPSPYMGYLDLGEVVLVSASPESLLRSDGRKVVTRPIAGTRPRGKDEEEDKRLAEELLRDEKERAEHVMLLDLSRNDLGRVAAFGSVRVVEPMHVEMYSHVMHLVSTVEGVLAEGKTPLDALASVLPMGTVSGAPKIRAMEIIEELEPHRRGPYGGSFGYLAYDGAMDVALTLRTFVIAQGWMHVQAGAGIVADSVPEREYEECGNKARALLRAVEMAEEGL